MLIDYPDRHPLPDGREWTAELESFDQRNDDAYYAVNLYRGDELVSCVMAVVHAAAPRDVIERSIAAVADAGRSNTDYGGHGGWRAQRQSRGEPVPDGHVGFVTWKGSPP